MTNSAKMINLKKEILNKINKTGLRIYKANQHNSKICKENRNPYFFNALDDFNIRSNCDPLMYVAAVSSNKTIILSPKELSYLIKHSNLKNYSRADGVDALYLLMTNNKRGNLDLTPGDWDLVIRGSDLSRTSPGDEQCALTYYLYEKRKEEIFLSEETEDYLIDNCTKKYPWRILHAAAQNDDTLLLKVLKKMGVAREEEIYKIADGLMDEDVKRIIGVLERDKIMDKIEKIRDRAEEDKNSGNFKI